MKKKNIFLNLTIISLALFLLTTLVAPISGKAGLNWFGNIGDAMYTLNPIRDRAKFPKAGDYNRKWTAEELFSQSAFLTTYYGERDDDLFMASTKDRKLEGRSFAEEKGAGTLKDSNWFQALFAIPGSTFVNGIQSLSSSIVSLTKFFTSSLFNADLICSGNNTDGCIDLVGILGGREGSRGQGIIGNLATSIYYPLSIVVGILTGFWILFQYFIKKAARDSLMGALWAFGAAIIGAGLLTVPRLIVTAPQVAVSTVSTCIVGGISGKSCLDGTSNGASASTIVGDECTFGSATGGIDPRSLVNSLNCSLWKTFILENYSQAQFGKSYYELYTKNPPVNGKIIPVAEPDKYCIHLGTSQPATTKGTVKLDYGEKVCNLALYQLYLQTDAHDPSNSTAYKRGDLNDPRWGYIIGEAAKDNAIWEDWKPMFSGSFGRVGDVFGGLITSILAAGFFISASLWGLMFFLGAILLTAFAPLFLLFAIHPGKGKKLFLGWLQTIVSYILKYMMSAVLVIVALSFYSAVLQNLNGLTSLLVAIVITGAMFMYRKELTDLVGAVNMGGEALSNKVADVAAGAKKTLKTAGAVTVGSAVGAAVAGESIGKGVLEGWGRQLKRGNSLTSNIARQYARSKDNPELQEKSSNKAQIKEDAARTKEEDKLLNQYKKEQNKARKQAQKSGETFKEQSFDEWHQAELHKESAQGRKEAAEAEVRNPKKGFFGGKPNPTQETSPPTPEVQPDSNEVNNDNGQKSSGPPPTPNPTQEAQKERKYNKTSEESNDEPKSEEKDEYKKSNETGGSGTR